jgi:hypothetical protein
MGIEINPVVDLAAAFTDKGQSHAIQESQTAAHVGGSFAAGEIAESLGRWRNFSDGAGRTWTRRLWRRRSRGEIER